MKTIRCAIIVSLLSLAGQAYAIVGGPFDNGEYSQTFDRAGVYQGSIRMTNGQGYFSFRSDDQFVNTSVVAPNSPATVPSFSSLSNRSVIFYKGIVYYGSCTGIVDTSSHFIMGITNGFSDATNSTTVAATAAGGAATTITGQVPVIIDSTATTTTTNALQANRGTVLVANGKGYICNTEWTAKVTETAPIYRFKGSGTLVAMGQDTGQIIETEITGNFKADLQTQLVTLLSKDTTGLTDQEIAKNTLDALTGTIDAYTALLNQTIGSPDVLNNRTTGAESVRITVSGIRKFL